MKYRNTNLDYIFNKNGALGEGRVVEEGTKCQSADQNIEMGDNQEPEIEVQVKAPTTDAAPPKKRIDPEKLMPILIKILYVTIVLVILATSLMTLILSIGNAILTRSYMTYESGRLAGMIVLAVTCVIAIAALVYGIVAVCRHQGKTLYVTAIVLFLVAVIQIVIATTSVTITPNDEKDIGRTLMQTFKAATDNNPRARRLWTNTQNDLKCCGIFSPDDYRTPSSLGMLITPDVPVSCCSTFESGRSELLQEQSREMCKMRREYYNRGCKYQVADIFHSTAHLLMTILILLIILEILIAIFCWCLSRHAKKAPNKTCCIFGRHQ